MKQLQKIHKIDQKIRSDTIKNIKSFCNSRDKGIKLCTDYPKILSDSRYKKALGAGLNS